MYKCIQNLFRLVKFHKRIMYSYKAQSDIRGVTDMPAHGHGTPGKNTKHANNLIDRHNLNTQHQRGWNEDSEGMHGLTHGEVRLAQKSHWSHWNSRFSPAGPDANRRQRQRSNTEHRNASNTEPLASAFTARTQQHNEEKKHREEYSRDKKGKKQSFLICWSHSQVILAPESGDPYREEKQEYKEGHYSSPVEVWFIWPWG